MSDKNRVLYLISRENVLQPGVLRSQVLDLVVRIKKESRETDVLVLNFPSIHSFFKYFRNYKPIKEYTSNLGIKLVIIPILPIGRSIMPVWAIPFFLIQAVPWTLFFVLKYQINIIHARAYLSTLTAQFLSKLGFKFGLVFDMRGAYPLEGITHGRWDKSNPDYQAWKNLEKSLLLTSDRVAVQSTGLRSYVSKVESEAKVELIPTCVDELIFATNARDVREGRRNLGTENKFVIVYSGSLGSFHEPGFLADTYSKIRIHIPNPHFLVATHSDPAALLSSLNSLEIGDSEVTVLRNPDLGKTLPLGNAGLHIMDNLPITSTVVAVKFGEYLASGLPVIVSKNMASVTGIVDKKGCGVVIDPFDQKDIRVKMQRLVKDQRVFSKNALKLAKDYFSVRVCAQKYLEIYDEISPKNKL